MSITAEKKQEVIASHARAENDTGSPEVQVAILTSRIQTQNRAVDWQAKRSPAEDAATLAYWRQPTDLLPTDGIVRQTALAATQGARTDVTKRKSCTTGSWPTRSVNPR